MGAFMLQSANGSLTMDISGSVYAEGTSILGNSPGSSGVAAIQPNQAWQAIPDPLGSSHYLIVSGAPGESNLCVGIGANVPVGADVTDDATDRGAVLTLQEQEVVNNNYQLWDFLPPTGGTGDAVFIQSPQTGYVIELQSHSTAACPLVVNPRRITNEFYQLWTAVDQNGNSVALPVVPMTTYAGRLHGFDNFIFLPPNQGDHLIGLTVTVDVIEDLVVDACSLQINCNTPYLGADDTEDYDRDAQWMQFGLFWMNNQLSLFNQIWHRQGGVPASELPSMTAWSAPLLQLSNNTVPAGTRIILNLCTDHNDFAIGMTGLALDSTGLPLGAGTPIYWPALGQASWHSTIDGGLVHQKAMAPVGAFQVLFCSNPQTQNSSALFSSGMGTLTITASPGFSPQTYAPNPEGIATAENSNMPYDQIPNVTARLVAQPFGLPPTFLGIPHVPPSLVGAGLPPEIIVLGDDGVIEVIPGDAPGGPVVVVEEPDPAAPEGSKEKKSRT